MIFGYFTLFVALVISAVAEFYSIVGLTSIFSAAFWPVVIMGGALGVGKVTAAVWLKLNWDRAKWTYKVYLVPAVIFLMFLTSMGIFGYLSKAHSDQTLVSGDSLAKIAIYDEKIRTAKENIDANRRQLKQMDEAVEQVMGRSTSEEGATKANNIRKSQQRERSTLAREIEAQQKLIASLNEQAAPLRAENRKIEAEVGPIKYIAAMIYGDNPDANLLEAAVRWVIIMIVAVFDPLALMLILAAQQSLRWAQEDRDNKGNKPDAWVADVGEPPTEEEKITDEEFRKEIENDPELNAFFERGRAVAQALDRGEPIPGAVEVNLQDEQGDVSTESNVDLNLNPTVPPADESILEQHPYLTKPFVHFQTMDPMVYRPEEPQEEPRPNIFMLRYDNLPAQPEIREDIKPKRTRKKKPEVVESPAQESPKEILTLGIDVVDRPGDYLNEPASSVPKKKVELILPAVSEAAEPPPKSVIAVPETVDSKRSKVDRNLMPVADNQPTVVNEVKAHFGTAFPDIPEKGELYLRVDYLPSRLFKYNGSKWIEVDKALTDSYVYNEEYVKYLIEEIGAGKIDIDDLSASERDQVVEHLNNEQSRNAT